ncbi:hypothetical protein GCM10017600_56090 [Streptosporangium carneum]|uniref:Uncharacterized protein n=1 Tax=Streptosporangium carneum TaxID=47481 RepID=A0A9W6I757_9ACTN|nr:hypothetical protein GCM10017600_56090 [Streptosporangium carneum]
MSGPGPGPRISRHVACLLGTPLDDPDVMGDELAVPTDDLSDCRHGCNGDCLTAGGPHECGYACHPAV